ncbi:peptide MFS transporter [Paeniglutamicibacter cryotolerans]|uniref:POT family proton-dependent oligopeptide transporter n=1 Tax=Paeniglutamicibacter cryotolerans TaxID=670079 RepID=A0A839QGH0_9MICC|nr:oligopeptide:H+ symporter [Paeniglutamicibacter cryotolerans]MBB2994990.1 POT family proton-dependent oligopeptide transporter [Paeniglutamicibacter cryotolerans]
MTITTGSVDAKNTGFFGHPRTLSNLFSVEMWERFSFYGMQAILAYYMYFTVEQGGLGLSKELALSLVGAYGGAVYLSTILGAWVADRLLGSERVLYFSAFLIMGGHVALALIPGGMGLAIGLVLVAVGSGGLKANATALVGSLYTKEDTRRDAGFSIFYMGVNVGGLLGPLLTGFLQQTLGFHIGFGAAAIGMALGLTIYTMGRKNLPASVHHVANPLPVDKRPRYAGFFLAGVVGLAAVFLLGWIKVENLANTIAVVVILCTIIYFWVILSSTRVTHTERRQVFAFIPLYIASAAFWALYQQQFTFIAVYSEERLDRTIFGWEMPASWVQSINPVFIIVLAGVFAALWTKLGTRQPGTAIKFSLSLAIVGLAFLTFIPLESLEKTPLMALVGILFLCTLAELLLSPIGQSVTTKLAPAAFGTQMVALFFLSISLGTTLAGILAGYYVPGNEIPYFLALGGTAIVLSIALAACAPMLKKLMGSVR